MTTVSSISSTPTSGGLVGLGQTVKIDLQLSEAVTVSGTPTLKLSDGGIATYDSPHLSAGVIEFDNMVASGQNTGDLKINSLIVPNGASITDLAGNPAKPTLPSTQTNLHLRVDSIPPAVTATSASLVGSSGTDVLSGGTAIITLKTSEAVTVSGGTPLLEFNDGGTATYVSGSSTSTSLVFDYVPGSETTADLRIKGINPNGATILDSAGNELPSSLVKDVKLRVNADLWAHGKSGVFSTGSNWTLGAPPTSSQEAVISVAGAYTVSSTDSETVAALAISNKSATLAIASGTFEAASGTGVDASLGTVVVRNGATLNVGGTFINAGTLFANGGTLHVNGTLTGGTTKLGGSGTVEIAPSNSSEKIVFASGATGRLVLDSSTTFKGAISGFSGPHHPFSKFFGFGDSTIDSGYFAHASTGSAVKDALIADARAHGGTGTPVGVGLMNSQILAAHLGLTATPVNAPGGGTNYAISGATNAADAANNNTGNLNKNHSLHSTVQQINDYLTAHGNVADPHALFMISSGGNDVTYAEDNFTTLSNQETYLDTQISALVAGIKNLQAQGAHNIIVHNSYGASTLAMYYSQHLYDALDGAGVNYIKGDIFSVIQYVKANPALFGFTAETVKPGIVGPTNDRSAFITQTGASVTTSGWGQWGANSTTPSSAHAYLRSADATQTSLYSDNEHLSAAGQAIEANNDFRLLIASQSMAVDTLDLKDIGYTFGVTKATFAGTATGGTLTVTDGTHTAHLALKGDYRNATFITMNDGGGGTFVVDPRDVGLLGYAAEASQSHSPSLLDSAHSANVALLGNYMAGAFATAATGHGGTLVTEASAAMNVQPLSLPHA